MTNHDSTQGNHQLACISPVSPLYLLRSFADPMRPELRQKVRVRVRVSSNPNPNPNLNPNLTLTLT